MSLLEFDCRFSYPDGFALQLAFQADEGVTALVGPSGSGKTTTLHLIAGLLDPNSGRIALRGKPLIDTRAGLRLPPHRRRIGLVFQEYQLFPHLTVEENLQYGYQRRPGARIDLPHLIEVLELGSLLGRSPATLSGGQKQRVALGRALASDPELLLLDEPVSALDSTLKASVLQYLLRIRAEYPHPTLLVTHDEATREILGAKSVAMPVRDAAQG